MTTQRGAKIPVELQHGSLGWQFPLLEKGAGSREPPRTPLTSPSQRRRSSDARTARHKATNQLLSTAAREPDPHIREGAVHQAVLLNMPVAQSVASRFRDRGVPIEDLEQVAYAALLRAARAFDPELADDFLSYAVPSMRGELQKYFRDHAWTVRPPRKVQEIQTKVLATQRRLQHETGASPTVDHIARELDEDPSDVAEALAAEGCFSPTSLDEPRGEGSANLLDLIPAEDEDRDRDRVEARVILRPALRRLASRDQRILVMRFFEGRTQQEIADELGISQMQVSRLLARIMRDLRRHLGSDDRSLRAS
jgi:RNA polymerase sigma-B factor